MRNKADGPTVRERYRYGMLLLVFVAGVLAVALLPVRSTAHAVPLYVDVTNSTPNPQVHLPNPGDYTHFPSYDYPGPGFSAASGPFSPAGQGTYHIPDGFLTGFTSAGLWQSFWLDALYPDPDFNPHGGSGSIDVVSPGGMPGAIGLLESIQANGLPAAPVDSGDTNGQYLGISAEPNNDLSEYALWETPFVLSETQKFEFSYYWSPAGATLADGTEVVPPGIINMGTQFFVLGGTTDYSVAGAIVFAESSALRPYMGQGNQLWFHETGTFTLGPGTYYWGFSATGDSTGSFITVEGISVAALVDDEDNNPGGGDDSNNGNDGAVDSNGNNATDDVGRLADAGASTLLIASLATVPIVVGMSLYARHRRTQLLN